MRRLVISLATLTMVAGCWGERDRRSAAAPDTANELAIDPVDSSISSTEASAPNPNATRPDPPVRPSKPRHRPAAKHSRPPASVPDTTASRDSAAPTVAGYAPGRDTLGDTLDTLGDTLIDPAPDSAGAADTVTRLPADSASAPAADSAPAVPATAATAAPSPAPVAPNRTAGQNAHTLPVGTEIRATLEDSIDSRRDSVGRVLLAHVAGGVTDPGGTPVVPFGSEVQLTITRLEPAKSKSAADGKLSLRVDAITIDGRPRPVNATVKPVPHELRGRGVTAGEAEKVGVGAAAGAVVGRVITGKTRGAVVGGVVGAAGGAVVAAQTASRDVVVHRGTTVVLVLAAPLVAATE